MFKTSRAQTPFDPTIPERPGWEGMFVHWLADRDHGGTRTTVFNVTEFPPIAHTRCTVMPTPRNTSSCSRDPDST